MLTLDSHPAADTIFPKPVVSGKWFEIRLTPDLITGEILNIGVGFVASRSKKFSFRLLESAAPFHCLYGPGGQEQFGFLLNVVRDSLETYGPSAKISPHISFGPSRPAQGNNAEEILQSLYRSVVTLGKRSAEAAEVLAETERKAPRVTEALRKKIRQALHEKDPHGFSAYWRDKPVIIPIGRHQCSIDIQLWQANEDFFSPRYFGSIVSVCYNDSHYRKAYLNGAYHDLTIARSCIQKGNGKGGFFILRPESSHDNHEQIENEIDNAVWALEEKFHIKPYVEDDIDRLKDQALNFCFGR
ncbi:MAG: hypothetical protein LBI62_08690 [Candidatus Accumulibacter sp.]|jgi:hypothetical protein|nr:hypothetical protein [Accumulibacter sp.]